MHCDHWVRPTEYTLRGLGHKHKHLDGGPHPYVHLPSWPLPCSLYTQQNKTIGGGLLGVPASAVPRQSLQVDTGVSMG